MLSGLGNMVKELTGIAPSQRLWGQTFGPKSPLRSEMLKPKTPYEMADYAAGVTANTLETALAGVDMAAVAGIKNAAGRTITDLLRGEAGVIGNIKKPGQSLRGSGAEVLSEQDQLIKEMSETPRWKQLGLDAPRTPRDEMTPVQELATLKQGPKTPVVPIYTMGDLDAQRVVLSSFKQDLGKEGRFFLNRMEQNRGSSAIHPNSKTGLSMDFSTSCPERMSPCPYCYVEHGRKSKELFNMHGNDKVVVETPYKREILAMPDDLVERMNSQGGMRAHSFGDYRPVQDYNNWKLALDDAEAKGLHIKAITKQPEFIEAFGDHPNIRINISVDALPREMSNSPTMEAAVALQAGRPNIKIRTVALNEAQAREMAMDPRVDVVTLYHGMVGDNLKKIIKAQNKGLLDKVGEKALWKEIDTWENMPGNSNKFKQLSEAFPGKICCQSGKCAGDPTKCGFGLNAAGGIIPGVLLPEFIKNEDDSDSSPGWEAGLKRQ